MRHASTYIYFNEAEVAEVCFRNVMKLVPNLVSSWSMARREKYIIGSNRERSKLVNRAYFLMARGSLFSLSISKHIADRKPISPVSHTKTDTIIAYMHGVPSIAAQYWISIARKKIHLFYHIYILVVSIEQ